MRKRVVDVRGDMYEYIASVTSRLECLPRHSLVLDRSHLQGRNRSRISITEVVQQALRIGLERVVAENGIDLSYDEFRED
jgi:hypothetical protein